MEPLERYQHDLETLDLQADEAQRQAVQHTQRLYQDLVQYKAARGWLAKLRKPGAIRGLYLLGGTGRGKTFLVDSFYDCIPFAEKHRVHFHQFMRDIHERLRVLPKSPDPLQIIAKDLSTKIRLLCLDEFHIHDIGDAMIMAGLLSAMFRHGIVLVTTSNTPIECLYLNGLQRDRFMETIKLLKQHTDEVELGQGTDYRLQMLDQEKTYLINCTDTEQRFEKYIQEIAPCPPKHHRIMVINDRPVNFIAWADDVIWFDFGVLCTAPRSNNDYLYLAEICHTVFISNVVVMNEEMDNYAMRFINLIDTLYDHHVNCVIAAADLPENLYTGRLLANDYRRTVSRLYEMGSHAYLATPHLAKIPDQNL